MSMNYITDENYLFSEHKTILPGRKRDNSAV